MFILYINKERENVFEVEHLPMPREPINLCLQVLDFSYNIVLPGMMGSPS